MSRINNKQVDHAHDIYIVIWMYNLMEYIGNTDSDNYSKFYGNIS